MAEINQTFFDWDDSILDFFTQLRLYLQRCDINLNYNAEDLLIGRDQTIGYLRGCMRGRTLE